MSNEEIDILVDHYQCNIHRFEQFHASVESFFRKHRILSSGDFPIIHSIKSRLKNPQHLKDKIKRKIAGGEVLECSNLFDKINDLIGIRILHLYQDQFPIIHNEIVKYINEGDWIFVEQPKAYTWDPESIIMYQGLGIIHEIRETYYTSVHYVIKPNNSNPAPVCCEIQVRTLFEEIWGEIDHTINYPHPTDNLACKEQLRVLSKLVSTGTRLGDSIFRTFQESEANH